MTWLTWRQFRAQTIATAAALAVLAVLLTITGLHVAHLYAGSGVAACQAHGDCPRLAASFIHALRGSIDEVTFFAALVVAYGTPAVVGVFWGAPLITREIEAGTFRLAWSQSVTRTRWLAVKLGLVGLAAMATAGLVSLMVTWWSGPIDTAAAKAGPNPALSVNRLDPLLFGAHGIVPVGYAALAFTLGVVAGLLTRRTLPAMAVTLAIFAAVQLVMPLAIRSHLITPLQSSTALSTGNISTLEMTGNRSQMTVLATVNKPGAWVVSNQTMTQAGQVFTGPAPQSCGGGPSNSPQACLNAIGRLHLRQVITYQPASRYWAFQWYETAIFLILALALAGFCFWRIRQRRLS